MRTEMPKKLLQLSPAEFEVLKKRLRLMPWRADAVLREAVLVQKLRALLWCE